jgi:hypothetical protein
MSPFEASPPSLPSLSSPRLPSLPPLLLQAYFDVAASAADGGGAWVSHVAAPLLVLSGLQGGEGRKEGRKEGGGGMKEGSIECRRMGKES